MQASCAEERMPLFQDDDVISTRSFYHSTGREDMNGNLHLQSNLIPAERLVANLKSDSEQSGLEFVFIPRYSRLPIQHRKEGSI
jgi:hypothetical protein